jgi:hypothetical protein
VFEKKGTVVLSLDYEVQDEGRTVVLRHPSLSGVMGFEFTTLDLAQVQLEAIRLDKTKSTLEEVIDDTHQLIELSSQLKTAIQNLRGK